MCFAAVFMGIRVLLGCRVAESMWFDGKGRVESRQGAVRVLPSKERSSPTRLRLLLVSRQTSYTHLRPLLASIPPESNHLLPSKVGDWLIRSTNPTPRLPSVAYGFSCSVLLVTVEA